jgi:hypothetical protein
MPLSGMIGRVGSFRLALRGINKSIPVDRGGVKMHGRRESDEVGLEVHLAEEPQRLLAIVGDHHVRGYSGGPQGTES